MIRNLGQVAAIYIGSSAPRNTNLIWLDNTVVPFVFRAYDGSAWSELATHKWVRAYVDGWLVTLPPRQLADDGDYMLINSNNVNYKITVKDFVKSAVGNPLDFKGVIRVSADFPNPSTLEAGDMYVIITSPVGGTVTDPYSGKTFEDSEKIVWDEVTRSWESLGKINITVNLTTSYSETEVTIHSSAGKETTIQGVTDQLAGVMLPGQYSWLQALSNGSIVPGDPSPLTPLTPAHKHNYNDIINRLVSQQGTGESTIDPMSQKATTDALNLKFDKASVLQVSGAATDKVMSQKAVTDALKTLSDDFNNKLTNYLPLAGGTMKGNIRFPIGNGIACNDVAGTAAYVVLRTWNANNSTRMYVGTVNFPTYISSTASDLIHDRNGSSYILWDTYNLPTPASTTDLANYLPLIGGTLTGQLTIKQSVDIKLRLQSTDADNHCIIQAINAQASQLGVFGYAGDKWVIGHNGTYYEIWDKYNLTNPVTYTTNTYNHATLTNKDGQYFTYIKAGTNGLLPHSKATLVSGGSGSLGVSDQSFNAAYINNLHTNKVTFGDAGSFIDNKSGDSSHKGFGFYTSQNAACPVYVGSLCVSDGYANSTPNIPTNGIYSKGVIKSAAGFTSNFRQTNLNLAKTGNDVLYISSFVGGSTGAPGTDSNTGKAINDGMFLTYFWQTDNAFQLVADIDGTGIAYRHYIPSTGNSSTGWRFLADTAWVVSKINSSTSNYLPLTGGTLNGALTINGPNTLYHCTLNSSYTRETVLSVQRKGIYKAAFGYYDGIGAFLYNYPSAKYLFVDDNGDARVGTTNGSTKLALITDIPTVSGYLPLSGGTLTGALTMSSRRNNVVVDVVGGAGQSWDEGAGALSIQVPNDSGQTPLILARRSGAAINTTVATERLLSMELLDTGHSFIIGMSGSEALQLDWTSGKAGTGKLFGKTIATTDQIPSIPSISISNSGSGNAVTAISASGHTLTVTKGATYLTSSSLDGYATQSWAAEKFPNKTGAGASGTWGISISGNATTATTASKLGSTTIGGSAKPIYLSSGTPTACSATVGSATVPVYMNAGTITQCSTTLGVSITGNAATATNATQLGGTAASSYVKANDNISRLTNDSGYTTQEWVNSQNFVKSTSTKKVTDIQPVDALPATQASGVLYLVFG